MQSRPEFVAIETTSKCNLACPMCPHQAMHREKKDMPLSLFERVVSQLVQFNFPLTWLHHYGEPLLNSNLQTMLEILKGTQLSGYGIATNAVLLDAKVSEMFSKYDIVLLVAVDAEDANAYMELRGANLYSVVVENVKQLIRITQGSRVKIQIQGMMTPQATEDTKNKIVEMFGQHSNVSYLWKMFCNHKNAKISSSKCVDVTKCTQPQKVFVVSSLGMCSVCCFDYDILQPIGDVNTETIAEIWNGNKRNQIIENLRSGNLEILPACSNCLNDSFQ